MLLKKEMLLKLIREGDINGCTIIGKPKAEVRSAFFKYDDSLLELFDKYKIENEIKEYDSTSINFYFPYISRNKILGELCSITIERDYKITEDLINKLVDCFLDETFDFYQCNLNAYFFDKIVSERRLSFEDMLMLIPNNQTEIANKIGKSRQLLSDMKSGKAKVSIDTLALLMDTYPLMPWEYYIRGFLNNEK